MMQENKELVELPHEAHCLHGVDVAMGEATIPGDFTDLQYDEVTGEVIAFTEEQDDAITEYEQAYWRFMEAGGELLEAFGFYAQYN